MRTGIPLVLLLAALPLTLMALADGNGQAIPGVLLCIALGAWLFIGHNQTRQEELHRRQAPEIEKLREQITKATQPKS